MTLSDKIYKYALGAIQCPDTIFREDVKKFIKKLKKKPQKMNIIRKDGSEYIGKIYIHSEEELNDLAGDKLI